MTSHHNYGLVQGFNELRYEHQQPSPIDIDDLLATLDESLDEGVRICERNVSSESKHSKNDSRKPVPSFSMHPSIPPLPDPPSPTGPGSEEYTAEAPTHPPFVPANKDERFVPDFMHSHTCKPDLAPDARNLIARLFFAIDTGLKEVLASRQLLCPVMLDPSAKHRSAKGFLNSEWQLLSRISGGWLGRWADPAPYDTRQRSANPETPPEYGGCFTYVDRDALGHGLHNYIAL